MKETWNPAEISEDIKPVNYVNADTWNAAELNEAIDLFGIKYPVDTWNPAELDEKARNIINDITSTKTITGNPISFKTINGGYAKSCEVTFSPIQSGSGDPSPENVRPISGRDSLHLYQDTEQTETPETTHTATFPDTVYGGKVVWKDGVVKAVIDTAYAVYDGDNTENWKAYSNHGFFLSVPDMKNGSYQDGIANWLKTESSVLNFGICFGAGSSIIYLTQIIGNIDGIADVGSLRTYLSTHNLQVTYPLATPTEITLTPETIALLKGNNTLWTDGDSIELKYTKLALPYDSDGLSLNQKVRKAIEIIKGKAINEEITKEETKKSTTKGRRKKS